MANFVFGSETLYPNSNYDIHIDQSEIYQTPEKDYEFVEVPGLNGNLLFDNRRFKNITIPINCFIRTNFPVRFRALMNYLLSTNGYQKLYLPQDEGYYRLGVFHRATQSDTGAFNKSGKFTLEFECKPQRFLTTGDSLMEVTESTITNPTNFEAKPMIRFYGNGSFTVNGYTVTVAGRSASQYIDIDCEMMTCSNGATNLASYVTLTSGYPVLKSGSNAVTYTSDSSVSSPLQMKYRWYEL